MSSIVNYLNSSIFNVLLTIYLASFFLRLSTVALCFFSSCSLLRRACLEKSYFSSIRALVGCYVFDLVFYVEDLRLLIISCFLSSTADPFSSPLFLRASSALTYFWLAAYARVYFLPFLWWYLILRMHLGSACHSSSSLLYISGLTGFLPKRNSDLLG